jgi:hypothetical protein
MAQNVSKGAFEQSSIGRHVAGGKDIPLHVDLLMRPSLSALGATRRWDTRNTWLATVNRQLPLNAYQLRATETDWSRGHGPDVTGPMLLLLTGRIAALDQLAGHGADALRETMTRSA